MSFTVRCEPSGPMRLAQPLLRMGLRRQFELHGETLRSVMEESAPPGQMAP